jgi:hypothetical protein
MLKNVQSLERLAHTGIRSDHWPGKQSGVGHHEETRGELDEERHCGREYHGHIEEPRLRVESAIVQRIKKRVPVGCEVVEMISYLRSECHSRSHNP